MIFYLGCYVPLRLIASQLLGEPIPIIEGMMDRPYYIDESDTLFSSANDSSTHLQSGCNHLIQEAP